MLSGQSVLFAVSCIFICLGSASYRIWKIKRRECEDNIGRVIVIHIFIMYICSVLAVTLLPVFPKAGGDGVILSINVIPFQTIIDLVNSFSLQNLDIAITMFFLNIGGNILLFVPFGLFCGLLFRKCQTWKSILTISLVFSLLIEIIQLIEQFFFEANGRITDIDDLILNVSGGLIGFLIYKKIFLKKHIVFGVSNTPTHIEKIIL